MASRLPSVSLSKTVRETPFTNPITDFTLYTNILAWERMKGFGRGVEAALGAYQATGELSSPITSRAARDAFTYAFAPRTLQRSAALTEDLAIRSIRSGNLLIDAQTPVAAALYVMGIQPKNVAKAYEVDSIQTEMVERKALLVERLAEAYKDAINAENSELKVEIFHRAVELGVPMESVVRSAQGRMAAERTPRLERTLKGWDAAVGRMAWGVD